MTSLVLVIGLHYHIAKPVTVFLNCLFLVDGHGNDVLLVGAAVRHCFIKSLTSLCVLKPKFERVCPVI